MKRLFISHAEKDYNIVKPFVELLYRIGLNKNHIFCSSISELGVPLKEDIYDYLRKLLDSDIVIPVFMLSENYYASAACLNEMGAVWLKQKDYYTFLLPGFTFKEIRGAINPNKRAIKLDNERRTLQRELSTFKDSIREAFDIKDMPISEQQWEEYRDDFIDLLIAKQHSKSISFDVRESQTFCIGDVNHDACQRIIDNARNTLIFNFDFSKTISQLCSMVLFTGGINLQSEFRNNGKLEFSLKASGKVKEVAVEMHLSSMNPRYVIRPDVIWHKYSISLCEFTTLDNLWACCKEICFVVDKAFCKRGGIEIKDVMIV